MAAAAADFRSGNGVGTFLRAYFWSMRPYYSFITGIAGWIGVAFARFVYPESVSVGESAAILAILFLAWGTNQIVNDWLGRKEDRINAPHRPMVTGELHPGWALALSGFLHAIAAVVTLLIAPWALVPLVAGTILNVVYEYAKGIPVLGNVVFGVMIAMCTAYGYLATAPDLEIVFTAPRWSVIGLVALMNGLMTYYTYFKDYAGDRAAGKVTAVVLQGIQRSRTTAIVMSFAPSVVLWILIAVGWIEWVAINQTFLFLFALTFFLQVWTGWLYYCYPTGPRAYFSLVTNFRACVCGQVMLIALFTPELSLYLYIVAYVFIGFLFNLHRDPRA